MDRAGEARDWAGGKGREALDHAKDAVGEAMAGARAKGAETADWAKGKGAQARDLARDAAQGLGRVRDPKDLQDWAVGTGVSVGGFAGRTAAEAVGWSERQKTPGFTDRDLSTGCGQGG